VKFSRLVVAGAILSVATHAAISAYFTPDSDEVEIAASEGGAVSVVGSLEDLILGTDGALEAVEAPPDEVQPVENAPEAAAVLPELPPQTTQDVQKAIQVASATVQPVARGVTDTRQVTAETVPPETSLAEPQKSPEEELKPVEPQKKTVAAAPATEVAAITPSVVQAEVPETETVTPEPIEQPVTPEATKAIEAKPVEATPLEAKPIETLEATTPAPAPPIKPKQPKKKKIAKLQAQKKKVPGADRNSRRGGEQVTSAAGRSNANGRKDGKSKDGGTKARSNYNGKVLVRLRRAKRYPSQARREHLQGTVTVRFTVARNGAVSGIRLARSSGHTLLDQAALDMVHRASPMPKVPDDIRGSRLSFTVPVRFSR
jgi:protein TonB